MYSALVIGCGNIGALYDIENEQILTHVKAFHLNPKFSSSIFDVNETVAAKISAQYQCEVVKSIDEKTLCEFDCVSICTPTDTHSQILKLALSAGVKVILCEKPISYVLTELEEIKSNYLNGKSRVLVNYLRRFQPSFIELKEHIVNLLNKENLTNISIKYQRGFLNNCSHAFDTIEFLTDSIMQLTKLKSHNLIHDHFTADPSLSLLAKWGNTNVSITGLSNVCFSLFEIELFFNYTKVCIRDAGQKIEIFKAEKGEGNLQPLVIQVEHSREHCIKNYMENVIKKAYQLLINKKDEDNLLQALHLNQRMLKYMRS